MPVFVECVWMNRIDSVSVVCREEFFAFIFWYRNQEKKRKNFFFFSIENHLTSGGFVENMFVLNWNWDNCTVEQENK